MTRSIRFAIKEMAAIMLALCMLTIIPAASTSFKIRTAPGGFSEVHKNGDTPVWMLSAFEGEIAGI